MCGNGSRIPRNTSIDIGSSSGHTDNCSERIQLHIKGEDAKNRVTSLADLTVLRPDCATEDEPGSVVYGTYGGCRVTADTLGDSGSAARFFYCAKASKSDRNEGCEALPARAGGMVSNTSGQHMTRRDEGYDPAPVANHHPTVKPTDLMRWLVRLVTPPGRTISRVIPRPSMSLIRRLSRATESIFIISRIGFGSMERFASALSASSRSSFINSRAEGYARILMTIELVVVEVV